MTAPAPHREFWRARLDIPNYLIGDAARYAVIDRSTVGRWHKDTTLPERVAGKKLSYLELIELAVVAACRKAGMKLPKIRAAREWLAQEFQADHPFATQKLLTDGVDLMMEHGDELLVANLKGQLAWKSIIKDKLKEFEYLDGIAARWHPAGNRSAVVIDPRVQFGRPSVRGVPTWIIAARSDAGEDVPIIAKDFGVPRSAVADALAFEGKSEAAKAWSH